MLTAEKTRRPGGAGGRKGPGTNPGPDPRPKASCHDLAEQRRQVPKASRNRLATLACRWAGLGPAQRTPIPDRRERVAAAPDRHVFPGLLIVFLLAIGCVVEGVPARNILIPILLPISDQFGIDRADFGLVIVHALLVGLATPPIGGSGSVPGRVDHRQVRHEHVAGPVRDHFRNADGAGNGLGRDPAGPEDRHFA